MKSIAFFTFLGVVALIGLSQAQDYCDKSLCQAGEKHIGCKHSGEFAKSCPKDKKVIKLTPALIELIVETHNNLRNELAGGKVTPYEGATRMASMSWDKELADLAGFHIQGCEFEHDECHNTKKHKWSGQNLAQNWWSGLEPTTEDNIKEFINEWFDEKKDANMDVIRKYPENWDGKDIGHFTAMIQEASTHIGCALLWMKDPKEKMDSNMMTCNYAYTNVENERVYEPGKPASKCKTGTHPDYKFLCSAEETY